MVLLLDEARVLLARPAKLAFFFFLCQRLQALSAEENQHQIEGARGVVVPYLVHDLLVVLLLGA